MKEGNPRLRYCKKTVFFFLSLLFLLTLAVFGCQKGGQEEEADSGVRICFVQTKDDADCILIRGMDACQEEAVLIDTGEEQDTEHILEVLDEWGVEQLKAVILTHPDKDHIGGAAGIVQKIAVDKVIAPYYEKPKEKWDELQGLLAEKKIEVQMPKDMTELSYNSFSLLICPPEEPEYDKDNNYSLAVLFQSEGGCALFTGDAMKKRTGELMKINWPEITLLKVPYHGRYFKTEEEFLTRLSYQYAVVTAGEAEPEVEKILSEAGAEVFYTRREDVVFCVGPEGFWKE